MQYANQIGYSDVNPFEVVRVISDKTLEIRAMKAELDPNWVADFRPGGFSAHCANQSEQKWIIEEDEQSSTIRIRLGKRGWKDRNGNTYKLSENPRKFYDFNF